MSQIWLGFVAKTLVAKLSREKKTLNWHHLAMIIHRHLIHNRCSHEYRHHDQINQIIALQYYYAVLKKEEKA